VLRPISLIVIFSMFATIGRCDETSPTKKLLTGTLDAIYTSADSSWFSIYASPSKFQKLKPTILLLNTEQMTYHVHVLKANGLIPAEHIAVAGRPGVRKAPNPVRLQIASSSMPQIGDQCAMETFTSSDGLIYAVHGSLRNVDTRARNKKLDDYHRTEP
jgi:hypothetical protein